MHGKITPFSEEDTFATFRNIIESVIREIDALDNEYILKASPTELVFQFIKMLTFKQ